MSSSSTTVKHTPMKQIGCTIRFPSGGFDLRNCAEPEALAATVVRACNAHEYLVNAVKLAKDDHQRAEPHHSHLCPICEAMDAALAAAEA